MKPLTIEIYGTGTHNRGAELMTIAIADRMRMTFPGVRLVVPSSFGDFCARGRYNLWTTWEFPGRFRSKMVSAALRVGAKAIRSSLGIIDPAEIDVVLDASGFAFSDQWGPSAATKLRARMDTPARCGKQLILLAQALGPFTDQEVASTSRRLFARSSLVCARDDQSHAAAEALVDSAKLKKYPDFTLGVAPLPSPEIQLPERFVAVVPNYRMLDKASSGANYLSFLRRALDLLLENGLHPVFVLHDAEEDKRVIDALPSYRDLPVLEHPDPRVLKEILGKASFVIGSRFHALVSALSQGIPCIGVGWSHKYPELFRDFDAAELLISDLEDHPELEFWIDELADSRKRKERARRITDASNALKERSEAMWEEVEVLIRNATDAI